MQNAIEQQQGRFERLSATLGALHQESWDGLSEKARTLLEEALTETALGAEDAQIALDNAGNAAA